MISPLELNEMKTKLTFKKIATFVCAMLCLATVLSVCAVALVSCGSNGSAGDPVRIRTTPRGKTLVAEIPLTEENDSEEVYLFGINFWQDVSRLDECEPLAKAKVKKSVAKAEMDVSENLSEALCKGYVFAKKGDSKYTPVTGVYYITNPRDADKKAKGVEGEFDEPIKGAYGTVSELLELGASSTVVTVNISELMRAEGGKGAIP